MFVQMKVWFRVLSFPFCALAQGQLDSGTSLILYLLETLVYSLAPSHALENKTVVKFKSILVP